MLCIHGIHPPYATAGSNKNKRKVQSTRTAETGHIVFGETFAHRERTANVTDGLIKAFSPPSVAEYF